MYSMENEAKTLLIFSQIILRKHFHNFNKFCNLQVTKTKIKCHTDPKFSDRAVAVPDQTAPKEQSVRLSRVYTLCNSICIFVQVIF